MDTSGSMNTNDRLQHAKDGANYFVDLVASNSAANPNFTTKIGVMEYNYDATLLIEPTLNYTGVHDKINSLSA